MAVQLRISKLIPKSNCTKNIHRQLRQYSSSRDRYIQYSKVPTLHYQASLPRLPIPKLTDSCSRYLRAIRPILNDEEYQQTEKYVAEFQRPGGSGELYQQKLVAFDKENKHTSYISGLWFDMYLEYRDRLVLNQNPYMVFKDHPQLTNQVDRAANIIWSSVLFKLALQDGVLAPEVFHLRPQKSDVDWFKNIIRFVPSSLSWYGAYMMNAFPLDMSQYGNLFNSTRLPRVGKDEIISYHDKNITNHILVLCRGHAYKLKCIDDEGDPLPVAQLKRGLQEITSDTRPPPSHPVGYLTTMKRDSWAKLREEMLPSNQESLQAIDSSLFVVCLDDDEPVTPEQVSRAMLYGDATNRWFDKSFSYFITPSGRTALNFEHAWGDGVAVMRLINEVYQHNNANPQLTPAVEGGTPTNLVEKVEFKLPDSVKDGIVQAKKDYEQITNSLSVNILQHHEFGRNLVKQHKLSPDAVMQLALQIAYYRLFKCSPASYESCSTSAFRHGRTETIRPASMATLACSKAFEPTHPANTEELFKLINESSKYHYQLTKDAAMGQGFDRHFFALKAFSQKDGQSQPIFEDPSFAKLNDIIISTSTVSSDSVLLGGFGPVSPHSYGIGYGMFDDFLGCNITTYPKCDGSQFVEEVKKVFSDFHSVFTGKNFKK